MANMLNMQDFEGWTTKDWLDFVEEHWPGDEYIDFRCEEVQANLYSEGAKVWHHKKLDNLLDIDNLPDRVLQSNLVFDFIENRWFEHPRDEIKIRIVGKLQRHLLLCTHLECEGAIDEDALFEFAMYVEQFIFHYSRAFGLPIVEAKPLHLKCPYDAQKLKKLYEKCVQHSIITTTTPYNVFEYRMAGVGTPTNGKIEWHLPGKKHKGKSKSALLHFIETHGKVRICQDAQSRRIVEEIFGLPPISASTLNRIGGEHDNLIDHLLD